MAKSDDRRSRRERADDFAEEFDDLPDGAFLALAAEWGIEPEDFGDEDNCPDVDSEASPS